MALRLSPMLMLILAGCLQPTQTPKVHQIPVEELTLQNLIRFPDGREYLVGVGRGAPEYGETRPEQRRLVAREGAAIEAQEKLIVQLRKLVPPERIRPLLRQAEIAKMEFGYDDACTLTLRIPKEAIRGGERTQW